MYTGITDNDRKEMLASIGAGSVSELFDDIPASIRLHGNLKVPEPLSELDLIRHMKDIGSSNDVTDQFIGAGAYHHFIPSVVDHIAARSEFYSSYTPYQAEVSQGTLVAIFEYQTMIARLTGMDLANASLYDGATAAAEAVLMSMRTNGKKKVLVSGGVHPNYRDVLKTYTWAGDNGYMEINCVNGITDTADLQGKLNGSIGCVVVQSPNFFGSIEDLHTLASIVHSHGAHLIVAITEPVSLGLIKNPGEFGADIVCGEGQSFGNPVGFGGPMLGLLSAKKDFMRRMPGRLVGKTQDLDGNEAYVLTLQAREQHIRRERATSNICTNQGLCALRAVIYLSLIGIRLRDIATLNHAHASYMKHGLTGLGFETPFPAPYFNEFVVRHKKAHSIHKSLEKKGRAMGILLDAYDPGLKNCILICVTEMNSKAQIDGCFEEIKKLL